MTEESEELTGQQLEQSEDHSATGVAGQAAESDSARGESLPSSEVVGAQPPEFDLSESSWQVAIYMTNKLGNVSSLFRTTIAAIQKDAPSAEYRAEPAELSATAMASLKFLIGTSPTLQVVFYQAAKNLYPERLLDLRPMNTGGLINIFSTSEISALLALTYFYRSFQKRCEEKEWERLTERLFEQIGIGYFIGQAIKEVGGGVGMFLGGIRYLSQVPFLMADLPKFQKFRREVARRSELFWLERERELWGCNHLQIAALLAQKLGFVMPYSPLSLSLGMDAHDIRLDAFPQAMQQMLIRNRGVIRYIESYHETNRPPSDGNHLFFLPTSELAMLQERISQVKNDASAFTWLQAVKTNLPKDVAAAFRVSLLETRLTRQTADGSAPDGDV